VQSFEDAARLAPNEPEYAINVARAKLLTGDAKGALAVMDRFLVAHPKNVPALQIAGAFALQGREIEKAAGYAERLQQLDPGSPATERMEGDLAMAQKRYKDALAAYRRAGAKGMDSALVVALYSASRLAGEANSIKVLEDWVAVHPEDTRAVAIVAEERRRSGNADGAITLYERGLEKAPHDPVLLNNLAVLYQDKGDPRAVELARHAYELMPKAASIMDTYGWILVGTGQFDEAQRLLRAALDAAPRSSEIRYHYAVALAKAGKADEARTELQQAVGGELPPAVRTDARKLLKQLSK
jgi:tetratricopeptide (TPR) repeat protein